MKRLDQTRSRGGDGWAEAERKPRSQGQRDAVESDKRIGTQLQSGQRIEQRQYGFGQPMREQEAKGAPAIARSMLSVRSWHTTRVRLAPNESRTPISRRRT